MRSVNLSPKMIALSGGTRRNLLHRFAVGLLVVLALGALAAPAAQAASLVVNTLDDELNNDGDCSLREAITAANTNTAVDACPAGSGFESDTITFSASGTIVLGSMLPNIADPAGLTIDGAGQTVTISGNNTVKVMVINTCATLDLKTITIADGYSTVGGGGGINNNGLLTVTDSTFSGNHPEAIESGGSVSTPGGVNITNSTFSGNSRGVSVHFDTARIVNSTFSNNGRSGRGAAIANDRGTVTIANSTFTANTGQKYGAIDTWLGSMTITDSTFSGNWAVDDVGTSSGGGAIFSTSTALAVANSTFVNNGAKAYYGATGGAISVNAGTVTVTNSTFSGNRAYAYNVYYGGWGGAIYTYGGWGRVDITNSTFLDNYALEEGSSGTKGDAGDAIRNADAGVTVTLRNTLVARYIPEQETRSGWPLAPLLNCSGPITDGGGNLQFNYWNPTDTTCPGLNADPLLDPAGLQDNGGPTQTIALLPGSPAIGAAVGATCAAAPVNDLDQRDAPRASCDIGAFEYGSTPPPVSPPDPLPPLPPEPGCAPVNHPPTITNPGNQTSAEGTSVSLAISAVDPDGDALTYSATGLPPGLSIGGTGLISGTLGYNAAATYTVTVTVTDSKGASASASFTWTVTDVNRPPVVTNPGAQTSAEGTSVSLQITASDPDGDALTYTATGLPPGLSIGGTGLISGTLGYDAAGTYAPTVTVIDGKGGSASASFTWTVTDVNRPPALAPVGNKTVTTGTLLTFTLSGSDPDGDALTYSATGLQAGAVLNASSGAFSWTPSAGQVGLYPTTFSVTDTGGLGASQTITITVTAGTAQNRDPVCTTALPSIAEIWPPNHRLVVPINILGITDPDGDPVTVAITRILQDEPTNTLGDGTTWIDGFGVGASVAQVRAERTGTPRVPGNGRVYEIQFHAADGRGGSCTGVVMVGVPHDQGRGPAIDDGIRYDSTVAGGPRVR